MNRAKLSVFKRRTTHEESSAGSIAILTAILVLSLWNGAAMESRTSRWRDQIHRAGVMADAGDWLEAETALAKSYTDWSTCQTYLHIVMEHDAVDDAEAMYRRAMAFAAAEEPSEFRAEIADLSDQLRLLSEMEQCSIKNIL